MAKNLNPEGTESIPEDPKRCLERGCDGPPLTGELKRRITTGLKNNSNSKVAPAEGDREHFFNL